MQINLKLPVFNTNSYRLSNKELIYAYFEAIAVISILGYFFYRSVVITFFSYPLSLFYVQYKKKELKEKHRQELQIQFKDALESVKSSLEAGYSLENAFIDAYKDMFVFYGEKAAITKELFIIKMGLSNNCSLIPLLHSMGDRSDIEDIRDFANVLVIGKQTGGNINEIICSFVEIIEEKTSVLEEISTMIAAKRFEQKILNVIPFFIIFYVEISSKGFFDSLYNNLFGRIIMTICLLLYLISIYMSKRITNIVV